MANNKFLIIIIMAKNKYIIMKTMRPMATRILCGNSCTCAHGELLHIAGTNESKCARKVKQGVNLSAHT